jgi:hypothetical protein
VPSLPPLRRLERLGLVLAGIGVTWFVLVGTIVGGRPSLLTVPFAATIVAVIGAGRLPARARLGLLWSLTAAPLLAAVAIPQSILGDGPIGYANASGALFVVAATAGIVLAFTSRTRGSRGTAITVSAACFVMPWLLGALTAALAGVAVATTAALVPGLRARAVTGALGLGSIILFLAVTFAGATYEPGPRSSPADRIIDASMGELRVVLWSEAIEMIASEPLTGVGPGRFPEESQTAATRDDARWAHNEFLQVAAESGIPGGVLLVLLVVWILAYLWPTATDPRTVVVIVAVMTLVLNATIDYIWHFAAIPVGTGLLVGATTGLRPLSLERRPAWKRPLGVVVLSTATLVLLLLLPVGPLNPAHTTVNGAELSAEDGPLLLAAPGIARSTTAPEALYRSLAASQEVTVQLWLATGDRSQDGPARIVSSASGILHRNITLGQTNDALSVRIRSTATDWNALDAAIEVPDVFDTDALQHVAVTTDLDTTRVFVEGELRWSGPGPGGSLANWNHAYPLLLGNEDSGDRPWRGEIHEVAVHDRVLSPQEIATAFSRDPTRSQQPAPDALPPVAAYTFGEVDGRLVIDSSPQGHGGDLVIPPRFTSPPGTFVDTFTAVGERPVARTAAHVALFALWAAVIAVLLRHRLSRAWIVGTLPLAGVGLVAIVSVVRFVDERSPSWLDAVGALIGALIGCLLTGYILSIRQGGETASDP